MKKTISLSFGQGNINHNNRVFLTQNVDKYRTKNNVVLVKKDIREEYDKLFKKSIDNFNKKQTHNSRKIDNYLNYMSNNNNNQKPFYELVIQIGDKDNTQEINQKSVKILEEIHNIIDVEYSNFHIINSVIHNDEATPHLHLDFIPIGTKNKRGLEVKNSMTQALKEMGFKPNNKDFKIDFLTKIRDEIKRKCIENKIEIKELNSQKRERLSVSSYKLQKEEVRANLKELDKHNFVNKIGKRKAIIDKQNNVINNLKIDKKNNEKIIDHLERQLDFYRANNKEINNALEYKSKLENEQEINRDLIIDNSILKQDVEEQNKLIISYQQANNTYQEDNKNLKNENKKLNEENSLLKASNQFLNEANKKLNKLLKTTKETITSYFLEASRRVNNLFKPSKIKLLFSSKAKARQEAVNNLFDSVVASSDKLNSITDSYDKLTKSYDDEKELIKTNDLNVYASKFTLDIYTLDDIYKSYTFDDIREASLQLEKNNKKSYKNEHKEEHHFSL